MQRLIKNGTVVNADARFAADVLVEDGRILQVAPNIVCPDARVVDASNCYVLPGFIDTHTHFDLDVGVCTTADSFQTGTAAAILGGTTTVLDFATQERGGTLMQALDTWHRKAKGSACNYGFHMAIAEWNPAVTAEMAEMAKEGVSSYKMYMVYEGLKVDDGCIYSALKEASKYGALIGVHCENWEVLQQRIHEVLATGNRGPTGHPLSRPAAVEAEAVARYMRIAELAGCPAYVVHLSTEEGLSEAERARERGQEIYLETCPQYLLLTDVCYEQPDGAKYVMSPPLRKAGDNVALWRALAEDRIDTIGTDHCSFTMAQKALGKDFRGIPNGGAGVQHRGELLYTYGVLPGRIRLEQMVRLLSANPARLFGMPDRGVVAAGHAADLVIWSDCPPRPITDSNHAYNCDNTPFAGLESRGFARDVFLNGDLVVRDGQLIAPGQGRYIARGSYEKPL